MHVNYQIVYFTNLIYCLDKILFLLSTVKFHLSPFPELVIALGCVTAVILVTSLVIIVMILISLYRRGYAKPFYK